MKRSETRNSWNNLLGGLLYTHQLTPSLRFDASVSSTAADYRLSYGTYSDSWVGIDLWDHGREGAELYSQTTTESLTAYRSKVDDLSARAELTYSLPERHDLHFGLQGSTLRLTPTMEAGRHTWHKAALSEQIVWNVGLGDDRYTTSKAEDGLVTGKSTLTTFSAYAEDDWTMAPWLKADLGLRLQGYNADGRSSLLLEPRASLRLSLGRSTSLKASYTRMSQGMFLLSSGSLTAPSEVWVAMDRTMKPVLPTKCPMGFSHELKGGIQLSVEGYYKWLDGMTEYREGASLYTESTWSQLAAQGRGRAYGVELLAQKAIGNTTGMVGYTWEQVAPHLRPGHGAQRWARVLPPRATDATISM